MLRLYRNSRFFEKILSKQDIKQGGINAISSVEIPLSNIDSNQKLSFTIKLKSGYQNTWDIWVYIATESEIREGTIGNTLVVRDKSQYEKMLQSGRTVLYIPQQTDIRDNSVGGLFIPDFWNYLMFKKYSEQQGI